MDKKYLVNRIMKASLTARDGVEYEVKFPQSDNCFRFFPALSKVVGTTTNSIVNLTVDSIIVPKELFKQDIISKYFTLDAKVLVGEENVCLYEMRTDVKIANNAYSARNIKPSDDDEFIVIAPLQIEIPAYKTISFTEVSE